MAAAGPVFYRIILHHSTYPFKPDANTTLAPPLLAVAVALLTANDQSITFVERPHLPMVRTRSRHWNDRSRLLFQSLCDTSWSNISPASYREEQDDEDLVAVLYDSIPEQIKWNRAHILPVATTLPSSYSRKLDGLISLEDVRTLLRLMVVFSAGERFEETIETKKRLENTIVTLSNCFPIQNGHINWEGFRAATADCMV